MPITSINFTKIITVTVDIHKRFEKERQMLFLKDSYWYQCHYTDQVILRHSLMWGFVTLILTHNGTCNPNRSIKYMRKRRSTSILEEYLMWNREHSPHWFLWQWVRWGKNASGFIVDYLPYVPLKRVTMFAPWRSQNSFRKRKDPITGNLCPLQTLRKGF